jgi:pyruvate formate lyase activating enzyme
MEKIGKELSVNEIAESVSHDKIFYETSGGGVTISGGEPTFQADFLFEILRAVKQAGIHTAIETCGHFGDKLLDSLVELVDLFLYDIKHIDSETHKKFTGVSNETILANFSQILGRVGNERIIPRIPLISGINDDADSIDKIAAFLRQAGYRGPVHLMPYNRMAKTKWEKIGKGALYRDMGILSDETIAMIASRLETASLEPVCNR